MPWAQAGAGSVRGIEVQGCGEPRGAAYRNGVAVALASSVSNGRHSGVKVLRGSGSCKTASCPEERPQREHDR